MLKFISRSLNERNIKSYKETKQVLPYFQRLWKGVFSFVRLGLDLQQFSVLVLLLFLVDLFEQQADGLEAIILLLGLFLLIYQIFLVLVLKISFFIYFQLVFAFLFEKFAQQLEVWTVLFQQKEELLILLLSP